MARTIFKCFRKRFIERVDFMKKGLCLEFLIQSLKANNVKKIVISSGARNIPFSKRLESDDYFECYSVVDERNAAFFALGLSQQCNEPVALTCTSGTSVANYLSGMAEAYYSNVPLIAITFDRSSYAAEQLETQKIDQIKALSAATKKSVSLPILKDTDDLWYCQHLLSEVFIAMKQYGTGPIHINVPVVDVYELYEDFSENILPLRRIDYVNFKNTEVSQRKLKEIKSKKVLLVVGCNSNWTNEIKLKIEAFSKKYKCPILADNLSNYHKDNLIFCEAIIKALNSKTVEKLLPDIIITIGTNFQERIKEIFRPYNSKLEHWSVSPDGKIKDCFKSQTCLFECSESEFFDFFNETNFINENEDYLLKWKKVQSKLVYPELPYGNFLAIKSLIEKIPNDSIIHFSILNATRIGQFYELDESVKAYSNVNTFGIDGCLPAFMGQAFSTDKLSFMVVGDLSFFYGMNALSIKHKKNNIRIMLINNGGAAEFHIIPQSRDIETIDLHIGAAHSRTAKSWAVASGYKYLCASNSEELKANLDEFVSNESEQPVFFEVFTDMKTDGEFCLSLYRELENQIYETLKEL